MSISLVRLAPLLSASALTAEQCRAVQVTVGPSRTFKEVADEDLGFRSLIGDRRLASARKTVSGTGRGGEAANPPPQVALPPPGRPPCDDSPRAKQWGPAMCPPVDPRTGFSQVRLSPSSGAPPPPPQGLVVEGRPTECQSSDEEAISTVSSPRGDGTDVSSQQFESNFSKGIYSGLNLSGDGKSAIDDSMDKHWSSLRTKRGDFSENPLISSLTACGKDVEKSLSFDDAAVTGKPEGAESDGAQETGWRQNDHSNWWECGQWGCNDGWTQSYGHRWPWSNGAHGGASDWRNRSGDGSGSSVSGSSDDSDRKGDNTRVPAVRGGLRIANERALASDKEIGFSGGDGASSNDSNATLSDDEAQRRLESRAARNGVDPNGDNRGSLTRRSDFGRRGAGEWNGGKGCRWEERGRDWSTLRTGKHGNGGAPTDSSWRGQC